MELPNKFNSLMNILIFSWRGLGHPQAGGAELVTHHHAKAWVKAGHTVTLFTSSYKGAISEEVIDGVRMKRKGRQYLGVHLVAFFWYLLQDQEFDLIVDNFHGLPFFTPLYAKPKKVAYIHEVAKELWFLNTLPWPLNLIIGILGHLVEPFVFLFYRKIPFMTASKSTKEDLVSWGIPEHNITIISHGVIPRKFSLELRKEKPVITYFGILSKDKGIEDALRCYFLLDKYKPDGFRFWIVGRPETGRYMVKLNKLIKELGLIGKIKMWGYVSEKLKFQILAKSYVLINPSAREGWGLVVIEGATTGTPTVGYNVPGLRDSIVDKKTGIICQENTAEDLSLNLISLLDNKAYYLRLCLNAIKWSKKFSWERSFKESLRLIQRVKNSKLK